MIWIKVPPEPSANGGPMDLRNFRLLRLLAALPLLAGHAVAQESGSAERGYQYAADNCAECHAIEPGVFDSPLYDVPSFAEIANSDDMSPIALVPFFQSPHPTMPNLVVPADSIHDLTAYLLSLRH